MLIIYIYFTTGILSLTWFQDTVYVLPSPSIVGFCGADGTERDSSLIVHKITECCFLTVDQTLHTGCVSDVRCLTNCTISRMGNVGNE